jgi:hypothetical protein
MDKGCTHFYLQRERRASLNVQVISGGQTFRAFWDLKDYQTRFFARFLLFKGLFLPVEVILHRIMENDKKVFHFC